MNYTIHQLRVFLKVVETGSVTKASEELHITQPAISIQLRNFQDQFKIPLTEIHGRRIHVTDFGHEIAEIASRVMLNLEELAFKTKDYSGLITGKLKIGAASTGKYVAPFFVADFINAHQGIDLSLDVTNKSQVLESLKRNQIDFALVSVLPDDLDVFEEVLLENKLYLISNEAVHNPKKQLIYREEGSATRLEMERFFNTQDMAMRKKLELTSNETVKQAILAGLGVSIMPLIGIKNEIQNGTLFLIDTEGLPIINQWRLIWLKNKSLSPAAEAFLSYIRTEKQRIKEKHFGWYDKF
jgi:DNA-binding transcriptional LysR family regulator